MSFLKRITIQCEFKYNSKVFLVGRFFFAPREGRPKSSRGLGFVPVHGTCWRSKNGFRDKFIQEKYFKENFKIRAKIDR